MTTDLSVCQDIFNRDPVRQKEAEVALPLQLVVFRHLGEIVCRQLPQGQGWEPCSTPPPPPPWWASPPPMIPGTLEATSCPAPIWTPPACCARGKSQDLASQ